MPTFNQRRAPFLVKPNKATAISKATPTVYSGTAKVINRWGGICATTTMITKAKDRLRTWSQKRAPLAKPEEYMVIRPAKASAITAKANWLS